MPTILDRLFRSRKFSISDPETLRLFNMMGWQSSSGVDVSPETAFAFSAVYCAVKLLSESIGSLPVPVYQRQEDGGKARAYKHPLYHVVHTQPNTLHSPMAFWTTAMVHLLLWGNSYSEIDRDPVGNVTALWPLPPDRTKPIWKNADDPRQGVFYNVRKKVGGDVQLTSDRVFHIGGLGFDGLTGRSVIRQARESIGLGVAQERLAGQQINNGQRPGIGIKLKGAFEDMDEQEIKILRESFIEKHSGIANAGNPVFLEEGMDLVTFQITPADAQFLESRQFTVTEIARWFNMPPHKLKDLVRATFSNIEEQNIEWVQDSLRPWCVRIEQAVTMQLLKRAEQDTYFAEFILDALLRGNAAARAQYYQTLVMGGMLMPNEARAKENFNPVEGLNTIWMPLNMIAVGGPDYSEVPIPETKTLEARSKTPEDRSIAHRRRIRDSYSRVLKEGTSRVIRGERRNVMAQVKKKSGKDLERWLDTYYRGEHQDYIVKELKGSFVSLAEALIPSVLDAVKFDEDPTNEVHQATLTHVEKMAYRLALGHLNKLTEITGKRSLRQDEDDEDEIDLFTTQFDEWEEKAPDEVARWETVRMDGLVAKAVWGLAGVATLTWVAGANCCPWCAAMDGRTVGIEESFLSSDDSLKDGDKSFSPSWNPTTPPLHDTCNCSIMPSQ